MSIDKLRKDKVGGDSQDFNDIPSVTSENTLIHGELDKSQVLEFPEYYGELAIDAITDQSEGESLRSEEQGFFQQYASEEQEIWGDELEIPRYEEPKLLEPSTHRLSVPEIRKKALIIHSSPSLFPDIHRTRKSAFGSTFLRVPSNPAEEAALLKRVPASNYSMFLSLLESFDKILSGNSETEQKNITLAYKESLMRALENHGIAKTYSDGSMHWDIYPITQASLFSIQVGDHVHQTRNLSRVENRIVTGPTQSLRVPHEWPTESLWTGHWDELGMAGTGTYIMPHGVMYSGKMRDGVFHDTHATLTYPNNFKAVHCVYDNGRLLSCQFQFPDLLKHEKENWDYCKFPDRIIFDEDGKRIPPTVRLGGRASSSGLVLCRPRSCASCRVGDLVASLILLWISTWIGRSESDHTVFGMISKMYCHTSFYDIKDVARQDLVAFAIPHECARMVRRGTNPHLVQEPPYVRNHIFATVSSLPHAKHSGGYWRTGNIPTPENLSGTTRFWTETRLGLKPAKTAQKTEVDPPRRIPADCYDTNDGFYNPRTLTLLSPTGELLRVPICEEDLWIKKYCRKGFFQPTNFRPDLYENWFEADLIEGILQQQNLYRNGKINFDDLQQYYANQNLLPSWSKYQRKKSPEEIAQEELAKSIVEPTVLKAPRVVKKHVGHKIPSEVMQTLTGVTQTPSGIQEKKSKSLNRFRKGSQSQVTMNARSSRISFKLGSDGSVVESDLNDSLSTEEEKAIQKRPTVSEKYLESQPLLRPPFFRGREGRDEESRAVDASSAKGKCEEGKRVNSKKSLRKLKKPSSRLVDKDELYQYMKSVVMMAVEDVLVQERERHRQRLHFGRKVLAKERMREGPNDKCLSLLKEVFDSIPDKEEGCDSDPIKNCDLKKLAEDKYKMLKYWGQRMYFLEFQEDRISRNEIT